MNDLIHTVTYISQSHLYVNLLCNPERQAPIRRTPLSSDNSCLNRLFRLVKDQGHT